MPVRIEGIDGLKQLVGQSLGTSDWMEISQEMVNAFADVTGDKQWIHTDPERARKSPFGGTIVHGFFTLALAGALMPNIVEFRGISAALNYGLNHVRFPQFIPTGSKIRMSVDVQSVKDRDHGGVMATFHLTFELEGSVKKPCVAEFVMLVLP